ncbi:MAG: hypothetical protein ACK41T_08500 [Pseudobdellovibrio sp.]
MTHKPTAKSFGNTYLLGNTTKKVKKSKMSKSDFMSSELYAPKDVWFGLRLSKFILEELKNAAHKEKMAVQKCSIGYH